MGIGPEDLFNLANDLLAAVVESLNTIPTFNPDLAGSPDRAFVSPGAPVFDWVQPAFDGVGCCDQVAINAEAIVDAPTSPGGLAAGQKQAKINHVLLTATVTRCVPVGDGQLPPAVSDLEASAAQIYADGWALWNHIFNLKIDGEFLEHCTEVFYEGMRSIRPSGGCGGWVMNWRIQLDGYED